MATQLYNFIVTIINNRKLYNNFNEYLTTLDTSERMEALKLYELVHSNNFLEVVKTLNITTSSVDEFRRNILEIFDLTS